MEQINTLLLSILLGFIVWVIAINQENPIVQAPYSERLPVTVRGLPAGVMPVQDLSRETVQVVLQAPRESWDNLEPSDFTAFIDLTGREAGVHDVEVQVVNVDPRVRVVSIQRPALRVQLDRVVRKDVPVRTEIVDTTAFGYEWQPPIVQPMTVTVTGPETQVTEVTAARAEVRLGNAKSQVERNQTVTPINGEGQVVNRVSTEPEIVHVVVPVEQWPGRKEVAVRVNLVGQPTAGYRLNSVRVNPSTVVLLGSADVLAQVPGFVETEPISLTNATDDIEQRVQVLVPEGATVLEGTAVDVSASISPIEGSTTAQQRPVIQGLGPGLEATIALETVDVILSGPLPFLEALGPDDVFVIVDLTGLLPGNHIIEPRVVVPTGIRAVGVLPETIEVVITTEATPEVTASPVVTGTNVALPNGTPEATPSPLETVVGTATTEATTTSPLNTPVVTPQLEITPRVTSTPTFTPAPDGTPAP